jgi:hypothetical protein
MGQKGGIYILIDLPVALGVVLLDVLKLGGFAERIVAFPVQCLQPLVDCWETTADV